MKIISLTACLFLFVFSCNQSSSSTLSNSLWRMRKVEILKNNQIAKVIDTGSQYWSFKKPALIEIFDMHRIQNILHISIGHTSIRSYDSKGALKDEYMIQTINNNNLALFTKKRVEDAEYNVIYYLDKVKSIPGEDVKLTN